MNHLKMIWRYLRFYVRAKTKYSVHSPFVYAFVTEVLEDERLFYAFDTIETLRQQLLSDTSRLQIADFGAGSHRHDGQSRRVCDIAASALSPAFECQLLFRIVHFYQATTLLEMGTSLGISALYLAEGSVSDAQIVTLEGAKTIAEKAQSNFAHFYNHLQNNGLSKHNPDISKHWNYFKPTEPKNIQLIEGQFEQTLPEALQQLKKLDFAFIDGNHRLEPTLAYFKQCLKYAHENTVFVFDDIHWSSEMEQAWAMIQQHPSVRLTIDVFWCGIVFLRNEQREREHFTLIKHRLKPFDSGFWG
jgi:predicted O-methyltransferase YrrM